MPRLPPMWLPPHYPQTPMGQCPIRHAHVLMWVCTHLAVHLHILHMRVRTASSIKHDCSIYQGVNGHSMRRSHMGKSKECRVQHQIVYKLMRRGPKWWFGLECRATLLKLETGATSFI